MSSSVRLLINNRISNKDERICNLFYNNPYFHHFYNLLNNPETDDTEVIIHAIVTLCEQNHELIKKLTLSLGEDKECLALKNHLLDLQRQCKENPELGKELIRNSGIYNKDGSLNERYKEHKRIEKAVQTENIDAEFVDIVNNHFWDLM
jgi:hypothetical protein